MKIKPFYLAITATTIGMSWVLYKVYERAGFIPVLMIVFLCGSGIGLQMWEEYTCRHYFTKAMVLGPDGKVRYRFCAICKSWVKVGNS